MDRDSGADTSPAVGAGGTATRYDIYVQVSEVSVLFEVQVVGASKITSAEEFFFAVPVRFNIHPSQIRQCKQWGGCLLLFACCVAVYLLGESTVSLVHLATDVRSVSTMDYGTSERSGRAVPCRTPGRVSKRDSCIPNLDH
jgi:hypothetical protein